MLGMTEGGEAAQEAEGAGPEGGQGLRKGASAAQDAGPPEAPAFSGEEPMVPSQQSSGILPQCPEESSYAMEPGRVCGGFLTQPRLPPLHCCSWGPNTPRQRSWEALQVPEPGAPGLPLCPESREPREPRKPLPRGHCLIHNWLEERATNELDWIPNHEESEGFRCRQGHLGLLTLKLDSPQASRTTYKDSYQHPGNPRTALRGKREAMLETLLQHQIRKEMDPDLSPPKCFNYESVTHHDYQRELDRPGQPPPTRCHCLQEQPETYWLQRASKLPGVSDIRTYDTPFRKNCSFSTPVHLSMEQPLPCGPENSPQF